MVERRNMKGVDRVQFLCDLANSPLVASPPDDVNNPTYVLHGLGRARDQAYARVGEVRARRAAPTPLDE